MRTPTPTRISRPPRPRAVLSGVGLFLGGLLAASPVPATTFDQGLPETGILDSGEVDSAAMLGWSRFPAGQGTTLDVTPRVRIGLPGAFDTAFSAPMRLDFETEDNALRHLRGEIGFRLPTPDGVEGSVRGYASVMPESEVGGVGSGSTTAGLSAQWASDEWLRAGPRLELRAALERTDVRRPDRSTSDRASYRLDNLATFDAGLYFNWGEDLTPYVGMQAATTTGSGSSQDHQALAVRPALSMALEGPWHLEAVAHYDLVERDALPRWGAYFNLTYRHRPARQDWEELTRRLGNTQVRVDEIDRRLFDLERRLTDEEPAPEQRETGLQILNHSGVPGLEERIAEELEEAGFELGRVGVEEEVARRDRTVVEYAPGYAEEARAIARALPGFQLIEPNDGLPDGVRNRVLLGFDLE